MNIKRMLFFLLAVGMLLLSGCNFPTTIREIRPTLTAPIVRRPVCPAADLVAPSLSSPSDNTNVGSVTSVDLVWKYKGIAYPYPAPAPTPSIASPCNPNNFFVSLSMAPLFIGDLGSQVDGSIHNWNTPVLQSGKTYRWSVFAISHGKEGPPSAMAYFTVGALCNVADLKALTQVAPANGSIVTTLSPQVLYESTMSCEAPGYEVTFSQDPTLATGSTTTVGSDYSATLPALNNCATYYWRVSAYAYQSISNQAVFSYSDIWSFKVVQPGIYCGKIFPRPLPTLQPTLSVPGKPNLPQGAIVWQVTMNANCRAGPGITYNETGFTPAGYMAPIQGRNEDGSWFRVMDPNGMSCWVSKIALALPDNWATYNLSVLAYPPPPPTEVPTPAKVIINCAKYSNSQSCTSQPACSWDLYLRPAACVNK